MGKLIKRKALTEEQYWMANKTMAVILLVCYMVYSVVELTNYNPRTFGQVRIAIYAILSLVTIIMVKTKGRKKSAMIFMALTFLLAYILLVMNNGVIVLVMSFPALIGFMLYLNSVVVGLGCVVTFIVCAAKCAMVKSAGDMVLFDYANLITVIFVICIYASYRAIAILYEFNQQDSAIIAAEAAHRAEVANTVNNIVTTLD